MPSIAARFVCCIFSAFFVTIASQLGAQTTSPPAASVLDKARALYYIPSDKGLQSFHCEVQFNWKDFVQKATNQQVPDTDERLKYLQTVSLSVDDDLHGSGELHWQAPAPPPESTEGSITKIRDGMRQMWSGFFQSWNSFLTGDLMAVDPKSTVERNAEGYHVSSRGPSGLAEEQFDSNLLLKSVHISTPSLESTISPTFVPSPQGLLVTSIRSSYKQPPSASATDVDMRVSYTPVSTFQLPSELQVAVGPAQFDFHLKNCTVQSRISQQ